MAQYPSIKDSNLVGTYPTVVSSGGGYVWDEVLEYRVWCHPHDGADDTENGNDYYCYFENYDAAFEFSQKNVGSEIPLALILQKEYIAEPEPGKYVHVCEERLTEWPVDFLHRPRRTPNTIRDFFSPNAPANRLDILRGLV